MLIDSSADPNARVFRTEVRHVPLVSVLVPMKLGRDSKAPRASAVEREDQLELFDLGPDRAPSHDDSLARTELFGRHARSWQGIVFVTRFAPAVRFPILGLVLEPGLALLTTLYSVALERKGGSRNEGGESEQRDNEGMEPASADPRMHDGRGE